LRLSRPSHHLILKVAQLQYCAFPQMLCVEGEKAFFAVKT